jgi:localization factor PodJL
LAAETQTEMEKMSMLLRAVEAAPVTVLGESESEAKEPEETPSPVIEPETAVATEDTPMAVTVPAPDAVPEPQNPEPQRKESYLDAARRAANAAVVQKVEKTKREKPKREKTKREKSKSDSLAVAPIVPAAKGPSRIRLALLGCAAPVVIVAVTVLTLNRHSVSAQTANVHGAARVAATMPAKPVLTQSQVQPATAVQPPADVAALPPPPPIRPLSDERPEVQVAAVVPAKPLPENVAPADAKSLREMGLKYLAGNGVPANDGEAARWLLRAAYRGEPNAQYWLGTLYERGRGVPEDPFQARHWYEAAAKKGNRTAMYNLAVADLDGRGVEKNVEEALYWFGKAAELGVVDSQFNLAVLYERGTGVAQSLSEAYKWYAIAAAGGDKEAAARVAGLANQLKPEDLAKARRAAAAFKPAPFDASANAASGPITPSG